MNKVFKNYLYNLSYQLLIIILPLITTPYVSRVLGAKGVGTFGYTNSIVQYFILFGAIGLNIYGQREIAYHQQNKKEYSQLFWELFIVRICTITISLFLFFWMSYEYTKYTYILYIQIIDIIASMIDISWFYQGIEDFKKIVIRNFFVKLTGVLFIFLFIKNSDDLYLYTFFHSFTLFLGNLSMWIYLPKILVNINYKTLKFIPHLKSSLILFIPQIAISLYTLLDKTMIGFLTNNEYEVGFYEQAQKIVKIALTLITSLGTVMMPRVANIYAQNDNQKVKEYMNHAFHFVFILGIPIMFGIIGITENLVPWFFGDGYEKVKLNMIIISPIILFIGLSNVMGMQYLLPTARQKQYTISVILGSIFNFGLNLILIPFFLSYGAAIATVCAEGIVTLAQFIFIRKDFDIKSIFKQSLKYFMYSLMMLISIIFIGKFIQSGVLCTIIQIICGIIVYGTLLLITKDPLINDIITKRKKGENYE